MNQSLQDVQRQQGAEFAAGSIPASFGNEAIALQAARHGVAICDRSHWGRIQLSDADRKTFLHNQSTNDFNRLQPGEGCDTLFVTSTARTIDLATAYILDDAVIVVVSPNRREYLLKWLDRYIFFGDKVVLKDVTRETAMFSLIGPESQALLVRLGIQPFAEQSYAHHHLATIAGQSVRVAVGSGLALDGYTLILEAGSAAPVWQALVETGAIPLGDCAWEQLRIEQGRPAPDRELTEDYNAVEASLWQAISINKGCYIGQETIARLDTYKGVKQQIWGIRLNAIAEPGTPIKVGEEKVGILTSLTNTEAGPFGLGYVRTKASQSGLKVQVGDSEGELVEVPFLQRDRQG
ncbi:CAF17-like 4Fe-4S cluster assembly/insertion protein YgfZ [Leptodesmis sichuanensis]|uniref:CAF17-like 4Fe-4S cluster assembly/insertion protein YgfZ n=1 Tax=Leptodesmis sichuanensis TaxID=2906798 RepID=UPI001F34C3B8|nr:folate-binding protein [Leptodesmis sichuanensis]UIE39017.1 folate-binding protein YgfZ [Leptodesmis sichuanensis A121]